MSDDRFTREPGDDTDEIHADRTHIDPKPRSWYGPASKVEPFDLAAEVDKYLDKFCSQFGIKRHTGAKAKQQPKQAETPKPPTTEDWKKL